MTQSGEPSSSSSAAGAPTVLDIRSAIAAGRTTVADEIASCRTDIIAANPKLGAFELIADEPQLAGDPALPLAGVSVGVKDLYDTADMGTAYGSPIFRGHLPNVDATLVARLRELGAFVAGKTVTTEFAWRQAGKTVNPWNHAHTPGGSSSGSAAAVAAGLVPLAIGTQTFGSILRPAAFCGVVGFKPTYGLLPLQGVQPLSPSLDHAGLFARTVADIRYVFDLLVAQSRVEMNRPPRLRLVRGPFWKQASSGQHRAVEEAADHLARRGASIVEMELPDAFEAAAEVAETVLCKEAAGIYRPLLAKFPDLLSGHIQELIARGEACASEELYSALAERDRLRSALAEEISAYDAILTMPALGEAPLLSQGTGNAGPCIAWTLLGVPAIALPHSMGEANLPLGLQLVGAAGADSYLLATAEWCSEHIHR